MCSDAVVNESIPTERPNDDHSRAIFANRQRRAFPIRTEHRGHNE
jgi:hypothetical protein